MLWSQFTSKPPGSFHENVAFAAYHNTKTTLVSHVHKLYFSSCGCGSVLCIHVSNKIIRYYLMCLVLYMFPKGAAHSFLLVSDRYIVNCDGGHLLTEVKAGSGRGGRCITVVADPLHTKFLFESSTNT